MLLPRMVAVGDMALDEALGPLLDPIDTDTEILPAIGSFDRLMLLAKLVNDHRPPDAYLSPAEALRLARKLADLIDALEVDLIDFTQIAGIADETDLAGHWQSAYGQLLQILPAYRTALVARKLMGPAERRNHLLGALERRLAEHGNTLPIIAIGITTSAKAVARVLRRVAFSANGQVILPGVDLDLSEARWNDLSPEGDEEKQVFGRRRNIEVHPQFHLKHLLDLMGVDRSEIDILPTARAEPKGAAISEIFCLPEHSVMWQGLPALRKSLPHAKWLEAEDSAQEAKEIAVRIRGALEVPQKRIALITPDRELAVRVAAQLRRWGIEVDDSAWCAT